MNVQTDTFTKLDWATLRGAVQDCEVIIGREGGEVLEERAANIADMVLVRSGVDLSDPKVLHAYLIGIVDAIALEAEDAALGMQALLTMAPKVDNDLQ